MTQEKLQEILEAHKRWLAGESDGSRADLSGANLIRADLSGANLSGANLSGADLHGADLSYANLHGADLIGADLSGAHLIGADLHGANLIRADLSGAHLIGADLCDANLSGANLCDADLSGAHLIRADLSGANLSGANLSYANLIRADLIGADLCDANLSGANLCDADLSGAQNLLSAIDYLDTHFERAENGYIVYKTFGSMYKPAKNWSIEPGSVIDEVVNPERQCDCGCGINVATLDWVKIHYQGEIWKCLIEWPWLAGAVVPYNTDGKIRCERVRLLEVVK